MISIRRSSRLYLWTLYWRGKGIAGLTTRVGFFIGKLLVVFIRGRVRVCYNGRWF